MRTKPRVNHRLICGIGIFVLLNIVFSPPLARRRHNLTAGAIATYDIIAPYNYYIYKSAEELAQERAEIVRRIPPIFEIDATIPERAAKRVTRLGSFLDSIQATRRRDTTIALLQREYGMRRELAEWLAWNDHRQLLERIRQGLDETYGRGILDAPPPGVRIIAIQAGDKEIVETLDRLFTMSGAESLLAARRNGFFRELVQYFLEPNVIYSELKTQQRVDEVFANITKTKSEVLKGEIIAQKHRRIDDEVLAKVQALEQTYVTLGSWEIVKTFLLRNILFITLFFLVINFARITGLGLGYAKHLYFISLMTAVFLIVGKIVHETGLFYLLPVSFFIFLFALYFNFNAALFFSFVFAVLFGVTHNSLPAFIYLLAGGCVASFSSQELQTRISLYRPMIYIALTNIISILFIHLYLTKDAFRLIFLIEAVINAILAGFGVGFFLPLLEKVFDFTTDLTLLELGNLNLPLFKEMSLKTPGTFHHSIVVGNLAEAGASAIGADPVLARVGAYYHDIGKLDKPDYFIENQIGVKNPHDNLKPQMSALVIISHIREGIEIARKKQLPRRIIDIIAEHHGTTLLEIFYRKALHLGTDAKSDDFSYPGPKPKTKEAALVMLADSVEAAARGEKQITTQKLKKILKDNFDKKFNDGQLDECPINRHDLEQIKTAFLPVLTGVFHPRIGTETTPAAS